MSADFPYKESFIFRNNLGSNRKDANNNMFYNTTKKTWDCGLCRRGFKEKLDLEQHLSSGTHDAIKFSCSQCGKGFASLGALTLHVEQAGHVSTYQKLLKDVEVLAASGNHTINHNQHGSNSSNNNMMAAPAITGTTNALYRKVDSFPADSHYQQQQLQQQQLLRDNTAAGLNNNQFAGVQGIHNNGNFKQFGQSQKQLNNDDRYRLQQGQHSYNSNNSNFNGHFNRPQQQQMLQQQQQLQNQRPSYQQQSNNHGFNQHTNNLLQQQQHQQQLRPMTNQNYNGANHMLNSAVHNNFSQQHQQYLLSHSHSQQMPSIPAAITPSLHLNYQEQEHNMQQLQMTASNAHSCVLYFAGYSDKNSMEAGCCFTLIDEDIPAISRTANDEMIVNVNRSRTCSNDSIVGTGINYTTTDVSAETDTTSTTNSTTSSISNTAVVAVNPNKRGKVIADDAFVINQYYPCSIQPEYEGLFEGLTRASEMNLQRLTIICDSELLYNHLMSGSNNNGNNGNGNNSRNNKGLLSLILLQSVYRIVEPLIENIKRLLNEFRHIAIKLITQDENKYMRTIAKSMFFKAKGFFEESEKIEKLAIVNNNCYSNNNASKVIDGIAKTATAATVTPLLSEYDAVNVKTPSTVSPTSVAATANLLASVTDDHDKRHIYRDILDLHKSKLLLQAQSQAHQPQHMQTATTPSLTQQQQQPSSTFTTFNTFNLTKNYNTISSDSPLHAHSPFIHSSLSQQSPLKEHNVYLQNAMYSLAAPQRPVNNSNSFIGMGNNGVVGSLDYNTFHNQQQVSTSRSEDNNIVHSVGNNKAFTTADMNVTSVSEKVPYVSTNNHNSRSVFGSTANTSTVPHSLTLAQSLLQHGVEVSNGSNNKVTDIPLTNAYFNNDNHHNHSHSHQQQQQRNTVTNTASKSRSSTPGVLSAYEQHLLECDCHTDANGIPCQFHIFNKIDHNNSNNNTGNNTTDHSYSHSHGHSHMSMMNNDSIIKQQQQQQVKAVTPMQNHLQFLKNNMMSAATSTGGNNEYNSHVAGNSNKCNINDDGNMNSFFNMSIYDE